MLKKSYYLLILFFSFFSYSQTFAQWSLGIEGGLNLAKFNLSNLHFDPKLSYKNGIVIGGNINYKINDYFNINSGLRYNQRGGKINYNEPNYFGNATGYYNYLELPMKIIYAPFDLEIKPIISAGVDVSYLLLAKGEGTINNKIIIEDDTDNFDNRIDIFLETGLGIMPNITNNTYYSLTVNYYYGVSDLDEYITTSGFHFLLGIYFKL
jgi:hypothetical protein